MLLYIYCLCRAYRQIGGLKDDICSIEMNACFKDLIQKSHFFLIYKYKRLKYTDAVPVTESTLN